MSSFSGFNTTPSSNPLNIAQRAPVNMVFVPRSPTVEDNNYEIGTEWENTVTFTFYKLLRIMWNTMTQHSDAIWSQITPGSGVPTNLTDQTLQQVVPDGSGNINVIGDGSVMTSLKTGASQMTIAITGIVPVPHGGTGVNTITNHAVMIGQGTAPIATVGPLTDGQLVIGSTGMDPVAANLTSLGGSITITNGAGTINLEAAGGSGAVTQFAVDAHTAPGTDPVVPTGGGLITVTGGQATAGTIPNAIQTNSLAANTYTIQVQRSSAVAATDATKNGVAHFKNTDFTVDGNGFVSIIGSSGGAVTTFTDDFAGTATPIAGDILVHSGNNLTVTAGGNALTFDVTGTTTHAVQVGSASGALKSIPLGTTGQALVAAGGFADPAFGVLPIIGGGTNATSFSTTFGTVYYDGTRLVNGSAGTAGQVWTSNGAGVAPSFQGSTAGFTSVVIQTFTSSGTYTPTAGMSSCVIEVLGGGAAGGGAPATGSLQYSAGSGGGAGEYARGVFSAATIGASKTVTIGSGGTGVSGGTGNSGGTTSVGVLITAVGGTGGLAIPANHLGSSRLGGLGGSGGTGGQVRSRGAPGTLGFINYGNFVLYTGAGGCSQYGGGGRAITDSGNGENATNYGSGGGGADNDQNLGAKSGGNGSAGLVIITEYIG